MVTTVYSEVVSSPLANTAPAVTEAAVVAAAMVATDLVDMESMKAVMGAASPNTTVTSWEPVNTWEVAEVVEAAGKPYRALPLEEDMTAVSEI